jgi:hypothetical protein
MAPSSKIVGVIPLEIIRFVEAQFARIAPTVLSLPAQIGASGKQSKRCERKWGVPSFPATRLLLTWLITQPANRSTAAGQPAPEIASSP